MAEKRAEDIARPDPGQGQSPSWLRFLGVCFGKARFELIGVKPGTVCWGVQIIVGIDGGIMVSVAAE